MKTESIQMKPIGIVHSPRTEMVDDLWGSVVSTIELDSVQFTAEALYGLEQFSHIEVIFYMDQVKLDQIQTGARHPRNRTDWPMVGIFGQRAKARPNRLGVSRCRLLKVEALTITVQALDAIDQTPVLDIKPYLKEFGPKGEIVQPEWSKALMDRYYV
ncbi:tRNA (N6-threonylcarbamoyladenosine(37)-N6)-methyltransferase TrmO [Hazenella sp. IB182353]|uniref:tRNA (N6-threonylcarbamoyladenosine(37)-N6)-methyltransferase TrmO n=1 Tax=Polycladospora coralii TaxID=2771432 RepID=UPI001BCD3D69|nr:tRNA (N6-threonylcarbamoyladenosine(37)-N6)-methyltransferase TrmO [Polycladospora coralii]MBS7530330.1 tRNA (N6-threonylcarbamoyladenosine(37)-N6)-methyltransferase TrmO [Polycladospora coralii]